jgi:hypothetical protein
MLIRFCVCLSCLLLLLIASASKLAENRLASSAALKPPATTQSAAITGGAPPNTARAIPAFDACSLINSSEIAALQGTPVQQTEPSGYPFGELNISQCYYTAITPDGKNLSVHLQVIQRNSNSVSRDALNEFWKARFKRPTEESENESKEKPREQREEKEEDAPGAPIPVSGIGVEAFWLASSRGGALFVRKDNKLVRVTIGGSDDTKSQIEKSRILVKKTLARLK